VITINVEKRHVFPSLLLQQSFADDVVKASSFGDDVYKLNC